MSRLKMILFIKFCILVYPLKRRNTVVFSSDQVKNWFKNRRKRESDRLGRPLTGGPNRMYLARTIASLKSPDEQVIW